MKKKQLTPLVAMSIWAKQHNASYGQAQMLMSAGKLTYDQLGVDAPKNVYAPIPRYELKICPECGIQFEPNMPYQKYCGLRCRRRVENRRAICHKRRPTDKEK